MKKSIVYMLFSAVLLMSGGALMGQDSAPPADTTKSREGDPFSQAKFVPDISFILDFSGVYRNMDNETFESLEIPGFVHGGGHEHEGHSHTALNAKRGFNLNYGEMALHSVVDPYFELFAVFHLSESGFEIEEAFANSTSLPFGLGLKLGKFMSGFGRMNGQHAHYRDFADQALVYAALLGGHGLNEKGLQLTWVAPLKTYLLLGAETLQGENELSYGTGGFETINGMFSAEGSNWPNVYTAFAKTSFDVGPLSVLTGASAACGVSRINHELNEAGGHGVRADTWIAGAELTVRYSIDSYRHVSWQSEYLYRSMEGNRYGSGTDGGNDDTKASLEKKQGGFYTQVVFRPFMLWRFGLRYDLLYINDVVIGGADMDQPGNLYRLSAMTDWSPTEFSRFRLQYSLDRSRHDENGRKTNHEIILQCNLSIGAHGAHSF